MSYRVYPVNLESTYTVIPVETEKVWKNDETLALWKSWWRAPDLQFDYRILSIVACAPSYVNVYCYRKKVLFYIIPSHFFGARINNQSSLWENVEEYSLRYNFLRWYYLKEKFVKKPAVNGHFYFLQNGGWICASFIEIDMLEYNIILLITYVMGVHP